MKMNDHMISMIACYHMLSCDNTVMSDDNSGKTGNARNLAVILIVFAEGR